MKHLLLQYWVYPNKSTQDWKHLCSVISTAQKMKFSIKDFFSKYDKIRRKLRIWSHLLKKPLMENFISVQCSVVGMSWMTE